MRVRKVKAKKEAAEKEAHPEVDIASDDASISKITTPPGSKKMQQMVCEIEGSTFIIRLIQFCWRESQCFILQRWESKDWKTSKSVGSLFISFILVFVVFICLFSEAKVQRVTRSLLFANPGVNAKEPAYYIDLHREKRAAASTF